MSAILVSSDVDLQAILTDRLLAYGYTILTADNAETAEQFARLPGGTGVLLDLDACRVHVATFLRWLQQYCPQVRVMRSPFGLSWAARRFRTVPASTSVSLSISLCSSSRSRNATDNWASDTPARPMLVSSCDFEGAENPSWCSSPTPT